MNNDVLINNVPIKRYGAVACRGFYEALLTPPSVKPYITNSSRLENGTRVVATEAMAKVESRQLSLSFFIEGEDTDDYLAKYARFMQAISAGEIELKVERLNRVYKLVYTSSSQYGDYGVKRGKFVLKFTEHNPANATKIDSTRP